MSEDREVWRTIPSLPDYIASSWGRIMRVPFRGPMPHGGERPYGGVPWHGVWEGEQGRYITQIEGKTYRVARLICEAFHGPPPFPGAVCMHNDENSRNNRPENLAWGTQKENLNAPGFLEWAATRCRSDLRKLSAEDSVRIRERVDGGESMAAVARDYSVSASHVSRICSGMVWSSTVARKAA